MMPKITKEKLQQAMNLAGCGTYSHEVLFGESRMRTVSNYRVKVILELRKMGYGPTDIGRAINRGHSNVVHLVKKYG